jgi:putative hydrolase of the HAD superfamily
MPVRAVTLDAAGTLFTVAEPVGTTYARHAARHGIALVPADAERRFRTALTAAPPLAFPGGDPARRREDERAWWRARVREVFGDTGGGPAFEASFAELFDHYARPEAWRVYPEVPEALARLRARGRALAVVSNFDARLSGLLDTLGLTPLVDAVIASTSVGAAKPAAAIFHAAAARLGVAPADTLHAGDSVENDVQGARAAGLRVVLVDRSGRHPVVPSDTSIIATLAELPTVVERVDVAR